MLSNLTATRENGKHGMDSSQTYLAKDGKVFGPYDATKIAALRKSGEFFTYEWMWDGKSPDWSPVPRKLHNPPPLPGNEEVKLTGKKREGVEIEASNKAFCAIAFDTRSSLAGEVSGAHSRGAKFVSNPSEHTPFSKGSTIWVDLLDEAADRSAKVKSVVTQVSRMGTQWVMELEWGGCPLIE